MSTNSIRNFLARHHATWKQKMSISSRLIADVVSPVMASHQQVTIEYDDMFSVLIIWG